MEEIILKGIKYGTKAIKKSGFNLKPYFVAKSNNGKRIMFVAQYDITRKGHHKIKTLQYIPWKSSGIIRYEDDILTLIPKKIKKYIY